MASTALTTSPPSLLFSSRHLDSHPPAEWSFSTIKSKTILFQQTQVNWHDFLFFFFFLSDEHLLVLGWHGSEVRA